MSAPYSAILFLTRSICWADRRSGHRRRAVRLRFWLRPLVVSLPLVSALDRLTLNVAMCNWKFLAVIRPRRPGLLIVRYASDLDRAAPIRRSRALFAVRLESSRLLRRQAFRLCRDEVLQRRPYLRHRSEPRQSSVLDRSLYRRGPPAPLCLHHDDLGEHWSSQSRSAVHVTCGSAPRFRRRPSSLWCPT